MSIKIKTKDISAIFFNSKAINKVFIGNKEVWSADRTYSITPTLIHVTGKADNPQTIKANETKTLVYYSDTGYNLPQTVDVTGATGLYTKVTDSQATLSISEPTDTVRFTITGLVPLATPGNLSVSGNNLIFDKVANATTYEAFADGVSIGDYNI